MKNLTIVITTRNRKQTILNLLKWLLKYEYEIQIIIIDDCSQEDNTYETLDSFIHSNKIKNVAVYRNNTQLGPAQSRQKAISLIQTNFFMFCDDDDLIDLDVIKKYQKKWEKQNIYVFNRICIEDIQITKYSYHTSIWKKWFFILSYWSMWGTIYNTNFYKNANISFLNNNDIGEDINIWSLYTNNKFKICKKKKSIAYYHLKNESSICNTAVTEKDHLNYSISAHNNLMNVLPKIKNKWKREMVFFRTFQFYWLNQKYDIKSRSNLILLLKKLNMKSSEKLIKNEFNWKNLYFKLFLYLWNKFETNKNINKNTKILSILNQFTNEN